MGANLQEALKRLWNYCKYGARKLRFLQVKDFLRVMCNLGIRSLKQPYSTFYAVLVTSARFDFHVGNMKFGTQNEVTVGIHRITRIRLAVHSSVPHVE
jgi:hypothetical protein